MKRLVIVRHGETDWNVERRIQGSSDVHLNALGRAQAAAAADALAGELVSPLIVASPLARALDTAQAVADACGTEVATDARLVERTYGVWEGLTVAERDAGYPEASATWNAGNEPVSLEGYERHQAVAARMREALASWQDRATNDLVFVTHGSSGRMLILDLMGLAHNSPLIGYLGNCTWSILTPFRTGAWTLHEHNARARR